MNTKHRSPIFLPAGLLLSAALLQGCSGGGSGGETDVQDNNGTSYLTISQADVYFGTRDVGTASMQTLTLTNQSADVYPVKSIALIGPDTKDFTLEYDENALTLDPGHELQVALTFFPTTAGPKKSDLEVSHDILVRASNEKNQLEQQFYKAKQLEKSREYDQSLSEYKSYIAGGPVVSDNKQRAGLKVPVLSESLKHADEQDISLYTSALNARDSGDTGTALKSLDKLLEESPQGYLADDALYLKGYIHLVDSKNWEEAYYTMLELRFRYPDSSYYDSALYVEAISQQELGNTDIARSLFTTLRDRHTGLSLELFNLQWPKDNYMSRLWFDRSDKGLAAL
ncbi:MAG: choice-of-anchor D domain-containing protein [Gammaproteobacteria bacterium]|nr:choice-of-anchor D domain-containing protein [Gammaproteobacteria bacterium]